MGVTTPQGWKEHKLGSLGIFSKGQGIRKKEVKDSGLPCVRYGEIYTYYGTVVRDIKSFIDLETSKQSKKLNNGDILFAGSGETKEEIGKATVFLGTQETYAGGDIVIFSPQEVHPVFLGYLVNSPQIVKQKMRMGKGDAVVHISSRDLSDVNLCIPENMFEQKVIAEALSDIDELISNTNALLIKKKQVSDGVKNQIFSKNENWISERLGKLAKLYQPETIPAKYFSQVGYPVYGANGVIGNYARSNHNTSQILISCRGNVGTVNFSESKAWINGNAMVVNIDSNDQLDKRFFYHLLSFQDFSKIATGSGQPQIVRGPLEVFNVDLPKELAEQQRLGRLLDDLDHEISCIGIELNKYQDLKKAAMNDLLTGKVRLV